MDGDPPGAWVEFAMCRGRDTEWFVCDAREQADRPPARRFQRRNAMAKALCRICPVRELCADWAMGLPDPAVNLIAGGMTHRERAQKRRAEGIYDPVVDRDEED